jgi:hypothetical protein
MLHACLPPPQHHGRYSGALRLPIKPNWWPFYNGAQGYCLLSAEQFVARLQFVYQQSSHNSNSKWSSRNNDRQMVSQALIQAVDKAVAGAGVKSSNTNSDNCSAHSLVMPPSTDLFVRQSIFMVDNNKSNTTAPTGASGTGIERALAVLQAVSQACPSLGETPIRGPPTTKQLYCWLPSSVGLSTLSSIMLVAL